MIVAFSAFTFWRDSQDHHWVNAVFECFNALTASWATVSYIGIGNVLADIWHGLTDWLYVEMPARTTAATASPKAALDWRAVLYHGNAKERVPLSALHAAGSYQSVLNEQRLPDTGVSVLSTMKMRADSGLQDVSSFPTMKMRNLPMEIRVNSELQDASLLPTMKMRSGLQYGSTLPAKKDARNTLSNASAGVESRRGDMETPIPSMEPFEWNLAE